MLTVYNILTYIAAFHVKLIAFFNAKMKLGVTGRRDTFHTLKRTLTPNNQTIWFHCASLGEYEQGLPVFEEIRKDYPNHKIVLSFFSPSGYEIRKNSPIADAVVYLPLDTKINAQTFIDLVDPELVIFVKYEIWPNYLKILESRGIRTLLISALFRKDQVYFKWYGGIMRKALSTFEHIFVQDKPSKELLETIGLKHVSVSGDTRFDRVSNQLKLDNSLPVVEAFKNHKTCIVAGSTWPEDEAILANYINTTSNETKFIIAPHNIKSKQIKQLHSALKKKTILYSERESQNISDFEVLIIDSIGLLSKIYSYADIAYVGGAIGNTGLHNTLEPAVFGVPIIIGNNYSKFPEAARMIENGGMFAINDFQELKTILDKLIENEIFITSSGSKNLEFIKENQGAVIQIIHYIRK